MSRRLYTESNVRELAAGSELVLGKDAIATPAALELAYTRGIRVRYGDGTLAPAASAGPQPGAALGKLLAQDGEYVVTVKGGRARVYRLDATGPVLLGEGS